jgi:hypothetical protein
MCYQSGRDLTVQSKSWDLESRAWYVDPDACFPPVFAEKGRATRYGNAGTEVCPVKAIPCWEGNSVRWDGGTYTLEEWRQKLTGWHNAFPNIIKDGSTPWETASFRSSQTSKVEIIKQCFGKCKRPTWPSTLTKASREFLQRFRVDMWADLGPARNALRHLGCAAAGVGAVGGGGRRGEWGKEGQKSSVPNYRGLAHGVPEQRQDLPGVPKGRPGNSKQSTSPRRCWTGARQLRQLCSQGILREAPLGDVAGLHFWRRTAASAPVELTP